MARFLGRALVGAAVVVAVLCFGFWLGSRSDATAGPEAGPAGPAVTLGETTPRSDGSRRGSGGRRVRPAAPDAGRTATVARIVDGDTLDLADGRRIRLVQIDTPELRGGECYADEATARLASLLPTGTTVEIETDPGLDEVDRYGRSLAYVVKGSENVNVTLVRDGAASVWFYGGARGKYAAQLEAAADEARAEGRGLWRACPGTVYDPSRAVATTTGGGTPAPAAAPAAADAGGPPNCDPNYEGACVPPYEQVGDLDCADIGSAVTVVGSDPHRFDGNDNDGLGCESYG